MAWDSSRACGEKKKERMRYHPGAIAINTGKSGVIVAPRGRPRKPSHC